MLLELLTENRLVSQAKSCLYSRAFSDQKIVLKKCMSLDLAWTRVLLHESLTGPMFASGC